MALKQHRRGQLQIFLFCDGGNRIKTLVSCLPRRTNRNVRVNIYIVKSIRRSGPVRIGAAVGRRYKVSPVTIAVTGDDFVWPTHIPSDTRLKLCIGHIDFSLLRCRVIEGLHDPCGDGNRVNMRGQYFTCANTSHERVNFVLKMIPCAESGL